MPGKFGMWAENPCRVSLVWVNKSVPGRFGLDQDCTWADSANGGACRVSLVCMENSMPGRFGRVFKNMPGKFGMWQKFHAG